MIAIHHRTGSFSEKWINYCEDNNIPYKIVNVYQSDIIEQLADATLFLWHWTHTNPTDKLFATQLIKSITYLNITIFPDINTCWHFDDKLGQKYLLEAIGMPLVPSHIFYDERAALDWASMTSYPKVFKLRSGAGSSNVKKVNSYKECKKLINRAFSRGFSPYPRTYHLKNSIEKFNTNKIIQSSKSVLYGLSYIINKSGIKVIANHERNYAYFQDFIPNANFDIRIIIIGNKAFGIKRLVRKGDFRASGSGKIVYEKSQIPLSCVKLAFKLNEKLSMTSLAIDFVLTETGPLIIEISYAFSAKAYEKCKGYWDKDLKWYESAIEPEKMIIEALIK